MTTRTRIDPRAPAPWLPAALAGAVGAVALALLLSRVSASQLALAGFALAVVGSFVVVAWRADPAVTFTGALLLAPLSGNWQGLGVPGILSLNRILLAIAVVAVLLRARPSLGRPSLRMQPAHWLMLAVATYAVGSALISGTLLSNETVAGLGERLGILPFLAFFAAPAVFHTQHARRILLIALVGFGAYLGLTALFETVGLRALVFPRYINDPGFGILPDRARGPFVEPAQNGLAMFTCAGACVIALGQWRSSRARLFAGSVGLLCMIGVLFTLTRAAWLGATAGTVIVLVVVPQLRRFALPLGAATVISVTVAFFTVPGFADQARSRESTQGTVYDRYALNRAALNMLEARPLVGFGWGTYLRHNREYLQQGEGYPLPDNIEYQPVHNLYLGFAAEIGLIGTTLWVVAMLLAVGGTVLRRGPPALLPWRWLLLGVATFYLAISNFEPTTTFSTLLLLLLAGVASAGPRSWGLQRPLPPPQA